MTHAPETDTKGTEPGLDLIKLYSRRILQLAADIPHSGSVAGLEPVVTCRSPLCGSTVSVHAIMREGRVAEFRQDVKACALGQASASILGRNAIGRTAGEIRDARDALRAMLKEGAPAPEGPFAELEVLTPARGYKNRHASILLAYEALLEAAVKDGRGDGQPQQAPAP